MKKTVFLIFSLFMLLSISSFAQIGKITGKWYTIDEDGNKKSLVNIYKTPAGTYEGVIEKLLTGKVYNCTMSFDSKTGKLKVRGSLDKSGLIGRNQAWVRAEN